MKAIITYILDKLSGVLKRWDDDNTGIDDALGNALKISAKVMEMAETGEKLTIETAETLVGLLADVLKSLDKDDEGWDDMAAFIIDKMREILMAYRRKEFKTVGVIALEVVHFILKNIDKNDEGIDDELAEKIDKILSILE